MNRFTLRILTTLSVVGLLTLSAAMTHAAEEYTGRTYKQKLIKSRAEKGYTNRGTVLYNYSEVGSYNDGVSSEALGNVEVDSRVREVHNAVIIHDDVKSKKDDLDIGQVKIKKHHSDVEVDNEVVIDGDVNASGETMEIGTVRMGKGGRDINIDNSVQVKGGINAK